MSGGIYFDVSFSATASTCNVVLMRNSELAEGIDVFDKNEKVIGTSKVAAKKVCVQYPVTLSYQQSHIDPHPSGLIMYIHYYI